MGSVTGFCPRLRAETAGSRLVSQAGGVLLVETVRAIGFDTDMSQALRSWRTRVASHDPAKVQLELAIGLAPVLVKKCQVPRRRNGPFRVDTRTAAGW